MVSKLFVKTLKASIYLQQIGKHFSHKLEVDFDSQAGRIEFPFGIAELNAEELGLNMIAKAENETCSCISFRAFCLSRKIKMQLG